MDKDIRLIWNRRWHNSVMAVVSDATKFESIDEIEGLLDGFYTLRGIPLPNSYSTQKYTKWKIPNVESNEGLYYVYIGLGHLGEETKTKRQDTRPDDDFPIYVSRSAYLEQKLKLFFDVYDKQGKFFEAETKERNGFLEYCNNLNNIRIYQSNK
ncbi:MAG: hypothetical protein ACOCZ6_01325 [Nanoarchaeota archaeon]